MHWGGAKAFMMILVTGGSGSGKSGYAEERACSLGLHEKYYLATMQASDPESHERILRHRRLREGKGFLTLEKPFLMKEAELQKELPPHTRVGRVILLEDLSNLLANEMFSDSDSRQSCFLEACGQIGGTEASGEALWRTTRRIMEGVRLLLKNTEHLVIVTNEIFSDGTTYEGETACYLRALGALNEALAKMADQVIEVVYGIPVIIKSDVSNG